MDKRLRPARIAAFVVLAAALGICGRWLGYWTLAPLALAFVLLGLTDVINRRLRRPGLAAAGAWTIAQLVIASSIVLAGGPSGRLLPWLAIPVVTLSARFCRRGVIAGTAATILLLLAVAFGVDGTQVTADWTVIVVPLALVLAVAILSTPLQSSDIQHRNEAAEGLLDPLTGIFQRRALEPRITALEVQSSTNGAPVGLIAIDIDVFKKFNDHNGHHAGDALLCEVVQALRRALRAFDDVYRIGGDEFLVVLPGCSLAESRDRAHRLAAALRAARPGERIAGQLVTVSMGVAASAEGSAFSYQRVLAVADRALYAAKEAGRDRVSIAPELPADELLGAPREGHDVPVLATHTPAVRV